MLVINIKRTIIIGIVILLIVSLFCSSVSAWSGMGSQSRPWVISSQTDLQRIAGDKFISYAGVNRYFELGADITLTDSFASIANSQYKFNGKFDGKGYTIRGLRVPFITESSGTIKNINFENCIVQAGDYGGILVSTMHGGLIENVNVENCFIKSTNAGMIVGGVLGDNAVIQNCEVKNCTIVGISSSGGITPISKSNTLINNVNIIKSQIMSLSGKAFSISG